MHEICKMNVLVVAATKFEIDNLVKRPDSPDVLITGVGVPATIFRLGEKLFQKKYDLVIQAGIAGAFTGSFPLATVVMVEKDTFGDVGIEEKGSFKTLFETGFAGANDFPFVDAWLLNRHEYFNHPALPVVKGITVNKITDDGIQIRRITEKFTPGIESMEGAAFHYVCLQQKINFLQLRSISNRVGERDKAKWKMIEAITNLDIELTKLLQNVS